MLSDREKYAAVQEIIFNLQKIIKNNDAYWAYYCAQKECERFLALPKD